MNRLLIPMAVLAICAPAAIAPGDAAAMSQQVPLTPRDVMGVWDLHIEGEATCVLALQREPVEGGRGLLVERCEGGPASKAVLWRFAGRGIELADAEGRAVAQLTPQGPDVWTGRDGAGRAARMTRAIAY